jgi:hypothetical protein
LKDQVGKEAANPPTSERKETMNLLTKDQLIQRRREIYQAAEADMDARKLAADKEAAALNDAQQKAVVAEGVVLEFEELRGCCGNHYGYLDQYGRKYDLNKVLFASEAAASAAEDLVDAS